MCIRDSYGCAATYARLLGYTEVEELLIETLEEEKGADEKLTAISEELNPEAMNGESEEDDDEEETPKKKPAAKKRK